VAASGINRMFSLILGPMVSISSFSFLILDLMIAFRSSTDFPFRTSGNFASFGVTAMISSSDKSPHISNSLTRRDCQSVSFPALYWVLKYIGLVISLNVSSLTTAPTLALYSFAPTGTSSKKYVVVFPLYS